MPLTGATTVERSRLSLRDFERRVRLVELRLRDVDRLLPLLDLLRGDGDAGQALAAREIALGLIERRLTARDIGLRLIERILKAPLIDAEQLLALAHLFVVMNKDVADQAGHVGGDRDDVGAHAAVARPRLEHVIAPELPADGNRHQHYDEREQHAAGRGEKLLHCCIPEFTVHDLMRAAECLCPPP